MAGKFIFASSMTTNSEKIQKIYTFIVDTYFSILFGPRDSRKHVLSTNKCHHALSRILFDLRRHCGDIPITIHKYFKEKR